MGKVINKELCKKLRFGYNSKWYMRTPESPLKNETRTQKENNQETKMGRKTTLWMF